MRAGRIGRTAGRAVAIALFGVAVTAAGVVGVQAAEPDEFHWESVPVSGSASSAGASWGGALQEAVATASEFHWE